MLLARPRELARGAVIRRVVRFAYKLGGGVLGVEYIPAYDRQEKLKRTANIESWTRLDTFGITSPAERLHYIAVMEDG